MPVRLVYRAFLVSVVVLTAGAATAQSPAKSFLYREQRFGKACPAPLKFAAGACVRRCPAGYENTGRYCRYRRSAGGRR